MGGGGLVIIVAMLALLWFVFVMPQRRRQQAQRAMLERVEVGDEILTAGGLYGFVREVGEHDELTVEIAPGIDVRIARRSVAAVVPPEDEDEEDEDDEYEVDEEEEDAGEEDADSEANSEPNGAGRRYPDTPA